MPEPKKFPFLKAALAIILVAIVPSLINLDSFMLPGDVTQVYRGMTTGFWHLMADPFGRPYREFRPLLLLLDRCDGLIWGTRLWGWRITNLVLFSMCGLLVWGVARKFLNPWQAWFAGIIFVIHPINVGTVAWILGRVDLLPGVLLFGCAFLLIGEPSLRSGSSIAAAVLSHLCFLLALLAKEVAVVFPAALFIGELAKGSGKGRAFGRALPSGIMSFLYLATRFAVGYPPGGREFGYQHVAGSAVMMIRDAASFILNTLYIFVPIWHPFDVLRVKYGQGPTLLKTMFNLNTLGPIVYICLGSAILVFWLVRVTKASRDKLPGVFAAGWFFIFLLPTMHVLAIMAGFRYFFISMLGAAIFLVWLSENTLHRVPSTARAVSITAFLVFCLGMNISEQLRWKEAFDTAERITFAAIKVAKSLPQGTILEVYDLPKETGGGRMVFPSFDTTTLPITSKLFANVNVKVIPAPGPECGIGSTRCISGAELMNMAKP